MDAQGEGYAKVLAAYPDAVPEDDFSVNDAGDLSRWRWDRLGPRPDLRLMESPALAYRRKWSARFEAVNC